jgi:hypothetical protein
MSHPDKTKYEFKFSTAYHVRTFVFFGKVALLKVVRSLKIYHHTKFQDRVLTAGFSSTSGVWTSAISHG